MFKRLSIIFTAFLITLVSLFPYLALKQMENEKEVQRNKYIASQKINDISQKLVEKLNTSLEYIEILDIIEKNNPNTIETIESFTENILKKHDIIKNVAIAPDGVIKSIYPTEPNLEAIGHDLMKDPHRYPFIKKAIEEKTAIMQGPVEAIQGGVLIFNRKAIFIREDNTERFWGICAVSIDFEKLVTQCGINGINEDYYIALKVPKTDGYNDFIWGNTECLTKESLIHTISIGDQNWEFFIYPRLDWTITSKNWFGLEATDSLYVLLSLVLFGFILCHLNRYSQNVIESQTDIMTGALNKSTFSKKVITKLKNKKKIKAIIVLDVDKFKSINDTYGHLTGDYVITEIAKRLTKALSKHDLLSRWGGDEFVIYTHNLKDKSEIKHIVDRIYHAVEPPFEVNGVLMNVGISLGYALYPDNGITYNELYKKADTMMYSNKHVKLELVE